MALTRIERNKIFKAIERSGANPNEFELAVQDELESLAPHIQSKRLLDALSRKFQMTITHNSGSTFRFREGMRGGSTAYVIDDRPTYEVSSVVIDGQNLNFSIDHDFDHLVECINRWADEVNRTYEAPDLWEEMQRTRELVVNVQWSDIGNTPFTNDERRQIRVELEGIKEHVKEQFDLTDEQIAHIDERLDEAAEAAERIGRKDWRLLAYGTVLNLFVTDALPPEVARHILAIFVHVVVVLFGGGPPQILA